MVEKIIYMKYADVENTKLVEWYLKVHIGNYNGLICSRNELERYLIDTWNEFMGKTDSESI